MKRLTMSVVCIAFVFGIPGCGGGVSEGQPASTEPDVPIDSIKTGMSVIKGPLPKGSPTGEPEPTKKK